MKKLFVHIGHYKTGTSAIQDYLSRNGEVVGRSNYLYPLCARPRHNPTNHGQLSLSLGRKHGFTPPQWYDDSIDLDHVYAELQREASSASQDNIIISSEEFVQLALRKDPGSALTELRERLSTFDTRIILYIREPLSLFKSWFNQVNKGPAGSKPFLTFFANLDEGFLSQMKIYQEFSAVFGAERVLLKTYSLRGVDHISDFLQTIGCQHRVGRVEAPVNEAQDQEILELIRLAKNRRHSYEEATISNIGSVATFIAKVNRISDEFNMTAAHSDRPLESRLSTQTLLSAYSDLLKPLCKLRCVNMQEAHVLRDYALAAEKLDVKLARSFMQIAHLVKPQGEFIRKKLLEYEADTIL